MTDSGATSTSLASAIATRASLGLNQDPSYVAALEADPSASRQYGIAMTQDEVGTIDRRVAVQTSLDQMTKVLEADPSYAGLWIDQNSGGAIVIETTGAEETVLGEVQSTTPVGGSVRADRVQYSLTELQALQDRVSSGSAAWRSGGVKVVAVGVDVRINRVVVDVEGLTSQAGAQLASEYGAMLLVREGTQPQPTTCSSRTACGSPIKGGLSITGGGWGCTSGYLGRTQPSGVLVLVTAGHCIYDSGLSATWYHNNGAIGTGYSYSYSSGASADAGAIQSSESGARNQVYASSNTDIRSMTGKLSNSSQPVGGLICLSGASTGWTCKTVLQTNMDVYVGSYLIHHLWETGRSGGSGDSGGATLLNDNWAGEYSADNPSYSWYTTVYWVASALSVYPCVVSNC